MKMGLPWYMHFQTSKDSFLNICLIFHLVFKSDSTKNFAAYKSFVWNIYWKWIANFYCMKNEWIYFLSESSALNCRQNVVASINRSLHFFFLSSNVGVTNMEFSNEYECKCIRDGNFGTNTKIFVCWVLVE